MHAVPAGLGRRPDLDDEIRSIGEPGVVPARVLASHSGRWLVCAPGGTPVLVAARGRLRDQGTPVAGDWVALDAGGAIRQVLDRRGVVARRDPGGATGEHVLAANVDRALVVESLPQPNVRRAERLIALASAGGVEPVLVLTKADLDPDGGVVAAARLGDRLGVAEPLVTSVVDDVGLDDLGGLLAPGETGVLLGVSGVGKSTLANRLLGAERQATTPIRAGDGRGRHTTVTRELLALPGGAFLLDVPGVRQAGVWDGTGSAFGDIDALAADCRFADCTHDTEPGCAVRAAVDPDRIAAWRKLAREQAWVDDRRAAAREREERGKAIARYQRALRRPR